MTLRAGASVAIGGTLENASSALIVLQEDTNLTLLGGGTITSAGTIRKNQGEGRAFISGSSGTLTSSGAVTVDAGTLEVNGGELRGRIDIAAGANFAQKGSTVIPSIISNGDGAFVVGGTVNLGSFAGQSMKLEHLILDSGRVPAITGLANLRIDQSFIWRSGTVDSLGLFTTMTASRTTFETGGTRVLSATDWAVIGEVEGSAMTLSNGARIDIESQGRWIQEGGTTIREGAGGSAGIHVIGELHKLGSGAFVVQTPLVCSGTLGLVGGTLTVQGAFTLFDSGIVTGGSTDNATTDTRLIVSSSADISGTIRPDLNGEPAYMVIDGNLNLQANSRIELDMPIDGPIPTENVTFLRGGQQFGGTLALIQGKFPDEDVDYRVISAIQATGMFEIEGGIVFNTIIQNADGVLVTRRN
jgi:hypothetical protein